MELAMKKKAETRNTARPRRAGLPALALVLALALFAALPLAACSGTGASTGAGTSASTGADAGAGASEPAGAADAQADSQTESQTESQASQAGGGAGAESGEPEPFTMYWWGGVPFEMGPQQTIEAYRELNPHIEIEYVKLGWDDASNTKLDTALMSGAGIDVYMPTRGYLEKAEKGLAAELTTLLADAGIDLMQDIGPDMETYMYDGRYFNIPTSRSDVVFFINMDKLAEAGLAMPAPDWTTDDLLAAAKAMSSGEGAARTYGVFYTHNWGDMWAQPSNGFFPASARFNADQTEMLNDPRLLESASLFARMQDEDRSTPSYAECAAEKYDPAQMLLTGKAAMVYSGAYVLRDIKNREAYPHTFKTGFALPPLSAAHPGEEYHIASLEDPIMISPKTDHLEESWDFVQWFYRDGFAGFIEYGRIPSYVGYTAEQVADILVSGYEDLLDIESFKATFSSARALNPSVQGVAASKANTVLNQQIELAMLGEQSLEEAIANGIAEGNRALAGE
jgi:multiple sugar transport system substrate-binding protein